MNDPLKGLKPTPGPMKVVGRDVWDNKGEVMRRGSSVTGSSENAQANTLLIADAFNTYTATGLAPSQLAARVAELELALTEREVERAVEAEPTVHIHYVVEAHRGGVWMSEWSSLTLHEAAHARARVYGLKTRIVRVTTTTTQEVVE